jgi:uncharacterized membrane protein
MEKPLWNDERIEQMVGALLQTGVLLAALVVLIGGMIYLAHAAQQPTNYHVFRGEPAEQANLLAVLRGSVHLQGVSIILLGLFLLIATPVARVLFSAAAFAAERDRTYVFLTLVVLGILLFSLFVVKF